MEGFVVVVPNGTPSDETKPESFFNNPQTWNSGIGVSLIAGNRSASAKGIDDVGFLTALVQTVCQKVKIDAMRMYAAGHSNGAGMAYRLVSERP